MSSGCYDPSECHVFPLIRDTLDEGPADFDEVRRYLAYEVGLTSGLASLFLMLFIHHERPEHQIQLVNGAEIFMADGGPLLGERLTPDLIPLIAWNEDLASIATSIGPASEPHFNDTRHHLSILGPEIALCSDDTAEDALAGVIKSIGEKSDAARLVLDFLEAGNDATTETDKLKAPLDQLNLVFGDNYTDVCHSLRAAYSSLLDLMDDLETLRQFDALNHDSAEIFSARTYIANARRFQLVSQIGGGPVDPSNGALAGPVDPFQRQGLDCHRVRRCGVQGPVH